MLQGWRWFGPADAISLKEIRQAGVTDIVTALYHLKCGELWEVADIQKRIAEIEAAGMRWSVVESLPVHEAIKTRSEKAPYYIEVYKQTLRNLAQCGVKCICYNFMPILDWTRTNLAFPMDDGTTVLHCDADTLAMFDIYILKRKHAEKDYSLERIEKAKKKFETLFETEIKKITDDILLGLPGTVDNLTIEEFQALLNTYDGIDERKLRYNLYTFLNEIAPLCEELGIKMAIHPDDPPRPIFGLPRIMSTLEDILRMFEEVPYDNIGITLCAGSLAGRPDNDVVNIFKTCAKRVHFAHFRNVNYVDESSFHEANHLYGYINMPLLMQALLDEEIRRGEPIVVRPDHGKFMEIDKIRQSYSGYSYGGRLVGLAELRGLELGLKSHRPLAGKVAVVTGGASALCSAMSEDLLRQGAQVAIIESDKKTAELFTQRLAKQGLTQSLAIGANILDKTSLENALQIIINDWGHIDILVNGAGGSHPKGRCITEQITEHSILEETFFGLDVNDFESVNKLNFIGSILPSQIFGKAMLTTGGSIVNIASMAASEPLTKVAAYSSAKAAIDHFTRWLATHLAPMNIRVNAIAPGFLITAENRHLLLEKDDKTLTPCGHKMITKTPMKKFGKPSDLCAALRFLVSDDAHFVTGIVLPVDGGVLAYANV